MREEERRRQIMDAAEKLFMRRRFHEITTDEIAAAANVGKGTIYRYFKDKEDLFHQTAMHGFEELCSLLEDDEQKDDALIERLLRICRNIDSFFRNRRRLFGMMQTEETRLALRRGRSRKTWRERRRRLTDSLAAILDDAVERGELRDDIPPDRLAGLLLGMLKSTAYRRGQSAQCDAVAEVVEIFFFFFGRQPQKRSDQ